MRDITVIGAGPVGLSAAFWAGMREASVQIIDSLPEIGGQLTTLYPEKWIFDVPGHPRVLARDLVELHRRQTLEQFDVPVHLETTAERITIADDHVVLHTTGGELESRTVILAGGHGAFEPKRLAQPDVEPWLGRGAYELVSRRDEFEGRDVLIVGGGDSALDWVVNLLDVAGSIGLVHRRSGFRAHEVTVRQVMDAAADGRVKLHVPRVVRELRGAAHVESVLLGDPRHDDVAEQVAADAVLFQLGFKTQLGPLKEWGFEIEKGAIVVDPLMRTSLDRVWACGDVTTFDGKLKLIATGYAEAAIAVSQAVHFLRPESRIQPKYSTNTGVPGAVAGQP